MEKVRIRLEGISKSYYSETSVTQALRKINLTFRMGEFVAITGESGSGKSTLLNIIGGMDGFDEGEMYVDGEATFQYDEQDWEDYRRTKIGYVFQDYSLIGHYSVLDNMTSALFVMGIGKEEAVRTAKEYLQQVGLGDYEHHRASQLSSGQKQRLSIARALAKNTGIIVADEPTGNLDSDTGDQILSLLKELSKDRLVIMVTHNYEQAAPYVTRKIRIHDGELILDMPANETIRIADTVVATTPESETDRQAPDAEQTSTPRKDHLTKEEKKKERAWQHKTAIHFAGKNAASQFGRAFLFTTFLLVIAVGSFLLIGELLMHEDDIYTKLYSRKAFYQEDDTRLVVKKADGSVLTEEDFKKISDLSNVVVVDPCDYANDINYYIEEEVDYTFMYSWGGGRPGSNRNFRVLKFLSEDKFMRSAHCITEADLAYGRLPESRNEVVLYAEEDSLLNESQTCYFTAANIWDTGEYYGTEVTIVGILKEPTSQIYFSEELCNMLSMHMDSGVYRLCYAYDQYLEDYKQKPELVPIISDDLSGNEVRFSENFENIIYGEVLFRFQGYDENGQLTDIYIEEMVDSIRDTHDYTADFLEVSKEFYERYYQKQHTQASVYITSYAGTDKVMRQLEDMGYESLSTFRVSATDYVEAAVTERLKIIAICAGGLLALLIAEVLILRSLMKIRIKDFFVLKNIGMKMQVIKKISYYEMLGYTVLACVLTIALMWGLRFAGIPIICDMMWYYDLSTYPIFVVYNLLLTTLTVAAFNHLLKGRLNA